MRTAMENIKGMVDVNTVVGDAVETQDGTVIIPVSRVSFGFAAGGGEYPSRAERRRGEAEDEREWPFGGGSGAGVTVQPVGFLVVTRENIRLLPVDERATVERLIDVAPEILERVRRLWGRNGGREAVDGDDGSPVEAEAL